MDNKNRQEIGNIYLSLDEAREEIQKRWNNLELRKKVEEELGENFMVNLQEKPRGVVFRQICSPDNGFTFFYQCSKYIGVEPLVVEYHDDMFTHMNEEKKGLGRLHLVTADESVVMADIMDFHENEKRKLGDCVLKAGEKLTDFHRSLFGVAGYKIELLENSKWFHNIGMAKEYYYYLLLHFVAHGVLFEYFSLDSREKGEAGFVEAIVLPNIEKIKEKFGVIPMLIRDYPENQTDKEDFYWWSYPPAVNEYLLNYVQKNKLALKNVNFK